MTSSQNCMKFGRWAGLRVVVVVMESDPGNIFMILHDYYSMQVNIDKGDRSS